MLGLLITEVEKNGVMVSLYQEIKNLETLEKVEGSFFIQLIAGNVMILEQSIEPEDAKIFMKTCETGDNYGPKNEKDVFFQDNRGKVFNGN